MDPFLHYLRFGEPEPRALRPKENPYAASIDDCTCSSKRYAVCQSPLRNSNLYSSGRTREPITRQGAGRDA
jgi:hypothetical protein